ncbi:MAG: hypothetical protein CMP10_07265 [Zetaproteobacteria bacterium]|nr:hypothetical protein [Pseudobdellovibrionaceae bacterium]
MFNSLGVKQKWIITLAASFLYTSAGHSKTSADEFSRNIENTTKSPKVFSAPKPPMPFFQTELSNPATLVETDRTTISAEIQTINLRLNPLTQRPQVDLALPSDELNDKQSGSFQKTNFQLKIPMPLGIHFGASGSIPENFLKIQILSGEERVYLRYSKRVQRPQIYTALGFALPFHLSAGLGLYHTIETDGKIQVGLAKEIKGRGTINVSPLQIPYAGIRWQQEISEHVLGLETLYRSAANTEASFDAEVVFATEDLSLPATISTNMILFYEPEIFQSTATWQWQQLGLLINYEIARWSGYKAPYFIANSEIAAPTTIQTPRLKDTIAIGYGVSLDLPMSRQWLSNLSLAAEDRSSALNDSDPNLNTVDTGEQSLTLRSTLTYKPQSSEQGQLIHIHFATKQTQLQSKDIITKEGTSINIGGSIRSWTGGISLVM